jgi:undecaprenyl-diphosphatase
VIGVMAHGFIKTVLFESTALICWVLIVGGIILLIIDRMPLQAEIHQCDGLPAFAGLQDRAVYSAWR